VSNRVREGMVLTSSWHGLWWLAEGRAAVLAAALARSRWSPGTCWRRGVGGAVIGNMYVGEGAIVDGDGKPVVIDAFWVFFVKKSGLAHGDQRMDGLIGWGAVLFL
jgi:hypothetical protein